MNIVACKERRMKSLSTALISQMCIVSCILFSANAKQFFSAQAALMLGQIMAEGWEVLAIANLPCIYYCYIQRRWSSIPSTPPTLINMQLILAITVHHCDYLGDNYDYLSYAGNAGAGFTALRQYRRIDSLHWLTLNSLPKHFGNGLSHSQSQEAHFRENYLVKNIARCSCIVTELGKDAHLGDQEKTSHGGPRKRDLSASSVGVCGMGAIVKARQRGCLVRSMFRSCIELGA